MMSQHETTSAEGVTVSVVIPTVGRPQLHAAVASALEQDHPVLEVLVCFDGPAAEPLPVFDDARVRALRVPAPGGGNRARQHGIESARGTLVALLDDDDTWVPTKLSTQLALVPADLPAGTDWISTSRLVATFPDHTEIWPQRLIAADEPITHYICRKHRPQGGQGFIQASTLLFPRALALAVPFDVDRPFHQDVDWLVSLTQQRPHLVVLQSTKPLTHYLIGAQSVSGGSRISPAESAAWAVRRLGDDRRSLGDFILTTSVIYAARRGSLSGIVRTAAMGLRVGRPGPAAVIYAAGLFVLTASARLRAVAGRLSRTA